MINALDLNYNHATMRRLLIFKKSNSVTIIKLPIYSWFLRLTSIELMNPRTGASTRQIGAITHNNPGVVSFTGSRSYQQLVFRARDYGKNWILTANQ